MVVSLTIDKLYSVHILGALNYTVYIQCILGTLKCGLATWLSLFKSYSNRQLHDLNCILQVSNYLKVKHI